MIPDFLKARWGPVMPLVQKCVDNGMTIYIKRVDNDLPPGTWPAWVWTGPAAYIPYLRTLAMTKEIADGTHLGYGHFRGDLHELGHAIWYLLLSRWEKWVKYPRLFSLGALIPYDGMKPIIEESFAQDHEAFWTRDSLMDPVGWGRATFKKMAPKRYEWLAYTLRRLGADVDRLV